MIKRMYLILAYLLLMLFLPISAEVSTDKYDGFCRLTKRDGLAGMTVMCMLADHNGVLWIGTDNGINKFNGKQLVTFKLDENHVRTRVFNMCESSDCLYAATNRGIYKLSLQKNGFQRIIPTIATAETVLAVGESLYIGNRDGFHIWNGRKLETIKITNMSSDLANSVRDIAKGKDGLIWFVTKYSLNKYNPKNKKIQTYTLTKQMPKFAAFSRMAISGNTCFLGTKGNGLFAYDMKTHSLKHFDNVGAVISSLIIDTYGMLCVGSDGTGAYLINPKKLEVVKHISKENTHGYMLPSDAIYFYLRDKNRVDWLGGFRCGLSYIVHPNNLFTSFHPNVFGTKDLEVKCYSYFNQQYVIGTSNGFYFLDKRRNILKFYSSSVLDGSHIVTRSVYFSGNFYVAMYDGGAVYRLNPNTLSLDKLSDDGEHHYSSVRSLAVSPKNELYIGTNGGLYVMDAKGHMVNYNEDNSKIAGGAINNISFDANGNAWICSQGGLTLRQPSGKFFKDCFPKGFFNKEVLSVGIPGHGNLYFFYNESCVYYTDLVMKKWGRLEMPSMLANENFQAFYDDKKGHYWVGTESGLFRMDYDMGNLLHFGEAEGLKCMYFTTGGITQDVHGTMWLLTSDGLYYVLPSKLEQWIKKTHNKLLLYNVRLDGENVSEKDEAIVNEKKTVNILWNVFSQVFQANVVLPDYVRSANRLYEYRVDNEQKWNLIKDEESIKLTGLMIGSHHLYIRLTGASNTQQIYTLCVYPSLAAISESVGFLLGLFLIAWWYKYRKNTKQLLGERDLMEETIVEMECHRQMAEVAAEQGQNVKIRNERSKLNEEECEAIIRQLRLYLDEQKVFLNPELKMSELADFLHVSSNKLSQIFNLYLKVNYYEFINEYRLQEFKHRIELGDANRFTLLALSEQCGFRKSSFFSTFRRVEGMTPTEYVKKHS